MSIETPTTASLSMDRGVPLGNSQGQSGRRALHVKIDNTGLEPIPITTVPNPFAPPWDADSMKQETIANVRTFKYYSGGIAGTLLKTITLTYDPSDLDLEGDFVLVVT
jgi:hypothetical protein